MRHKFFFLFVFAFLILIPSQEVFASGSATVTRGASMLPITVTVQNAGSCITGTSYPAVAGDGIAAEWGLFVPGSGTSTFTFTGGKRVYAPVNTAIDAIPDYTFSCLDISSGATDTTTLYVNDCPGGTTWNDTTHVCEVAIIPTSSITVNPATSVGAGNTSIRYDSNATSCVFQYQAPWSSTWSDVANPGPASHDYGSQGPYGVGTHTWRLDCTKTGYVYTQKTATFTVTSPAAPTLSVTANPLSVPFGGGSTVVTWTVNGADSCYAQDNSFTQNGSNYWLTSANGANTSTQNVTFPVTFKVECWNGGVTSGVQSVSVSVAAAPAALHLCPTSAVLNQGASQTLNAWYTPIGTSFVGCSSNPSGAANHSDQRTNASWSSSDIAKVSVNSSGLVTGVATGSANITAVYSGVQDTTSITVTCTQNVFCTPAERASVCVGSNFNYTDNCGTPQSCPGTRSCNYNWKEVAP